MVLDSETASSWNIPRRDNIFNLGSATKRWAALFVVMIAATAMSIGGINLFNDGGSLFISNSTVINGSLNVSGSVNASNFCYLNGTCLEDLNFSYWEMFGDDIRNINHGHDVHTDRHLMVEENLYVDTFYTDTGRNHYLTVENAVDTTFTFNGTSINDNFWVFEDFDYLEVGFPSGFELRYGLHSGGSDGDVYFDDSDIYMEDLFVSDDVKVAGEMQGSRMLLHSGNSKGDISGRAVYHHFAGSGYQMGVNVGYPMPRAGSVVGVSVIYYVTSIMFSGSFRVSIMKNGFTTLWNVDDLVSGTGKHIHYATQARDIDKFAAGDTIEIKVDALYTGGYSWSEVITEIQFDT